MKHILSNINNHLPLYGGSRGVFILLLLCLATFTSCSDDEWANGDPEMENIYYIGFQDWGTFKNDVKYDAPQGTTVAIPMQFYCEFIRNYDVVTYYYVTSSLTLGTDYQVVDEAGKTLQPDATGAYTITWPQAKKGVKNVYIKALNGKKGAVTVQTFDSNSPVKLSNQDIESTVQHRESQYEVRVFTQNYKVTVNIK